MKRSFQFCISTSNICNLKCPSCPIGRREEQKAVEWLTPQKLQAIMTKATGECRVPRVTFVGWCEPTLNPDLPLMVRIVRDHKVACWVTTNLTAKFDMDALLEASPEMIIVSTSGVTQRTFAVDHPGGDVSAMLDRLWYLAAHKRKGTKLMVLWHRYNYNEAEMSQMEGLCKRAGIHFCPVFGKLLGIEAMQAAFVGSRDHDAVIGRMIHHILDIKEACFKHRKAPCREIQRSITIDAWGRVRVCGVAYHNGYMGDYLATPIDSLIVSKENNPFCRRCMTRGTHNWANETMTWKRRMIDRVIGVGFATVGRLMTIKPTMHKGLSTDQ